MPFGGKHQLTPAQAMVAKLPVARRDHHRAAAWPGASTLTLSEAEPVHRRLPGRGRIASLKLVAAGFKRQDAYLTFQEYFERLRGDAEALGQARGCRCWARSWRRSTWASAPSAARTPCPAASSSSTCRPRSCPSPRRCGKVGRVTSPEFKGAGHRVAVDRPALLRRRRASRPRPRMRCAAMRRRAGADRQRCRAGGLHAGLWLHGRGAVQDVRWATASASQLDERRRRSRCSRLRTAASWWNWPTTRSCPPQPITWTSSCWAPPLRTIASSPRARTLDMAALQEAWEGAHRERVPVPPGGRGRRSR